MKTLFISLFFLLFQSIATADENLTLLFGLDPILHYERENDYNERSHIRGAKYKDYSFYSFTNSYDKESWIITKETWNKHYFQYDRINLYTGLEFGIVRGYRGTTLDTIAGFLPVILWTNDINYRFSEDLIFGINISIIPAFDNSVFTKNFTITYEF